MKRKKVKLFLAIGAVLLLIVGKIMMKPTQKTEEIQPNLSEKVNDTKKASEESVKTYKDLIVETLENYDERLGEEDTQVVSQAIIDVYDYIGKLDNYSDVTPSQENGLFLTSQGMIQAMGYVYGLGYRLDENTIEVYPSKSENVYQFTYQVIADDVNPINYAGNYAINSKQLEIVHQIGTIEKVGDAHDEDGAHSH